MSFLSHLNSAQSGLLSPDTVKHLNPVMDWMQTTWLSHLALDYSQTWPTLEITHYIGLSLLFGSILVMDLRLMGVQHPVISSLSIHRMLPMAFIGFGLNLLTGIIFCFGDPHRYAINISFQLKMICVLLAGINALIYWRKIGPMLAAVPPNADPPLPAKAVGFMSILLWTLVLIFGRLIPYLGTG
ncbi:MAG TPA: DUF6644 family protein [Gammaproteobacteria bacterium]|nr:DUF6644 family protein [Gammaproteobacteria bacterium]